jgi:hypothetical protein
MINLKSLFAKPTYPADPVAFTEILETRRCWAVRLSGDPDLDWPLLTLVHGWQTRFQQIELFVPSVFLEFVRALPFMVHVRVEAADSGTTVPAGSFVLDLEPRTPLLEAPGSAVLSPKPGANLQLDPAPKTGLDWLRLLSALLRIPLEVTVPIPKIQPDGRDLLIDNTFPHVYIHLQRKYRKTQVLDVLAFLKQNLSVNIYLEAPAKYNFDLPGFVEFDNSDLFCRYAFARATDLTISDGESFLVDLPLRFMAWDHLKPEALNEESQNAELTNELRSLLMRKIGA